MTATNSHYFTHISIEKVGPNVILELGTERAKRWTDLYVLYWVDGPIEPAVSVELSLQGKKDRTQLMGWRNMAMRFVRIAALIVNKLTIPNVIEI